MKYYPPAEIEKSLIDRLFDPVKDFISEHKSLAVAGLTTLALVGGITMGSILSRPVKPIQSTQPPKVVERIITPTLIPTIYRTPVPKTTHTPTQVPPTEIPTLTPTYTPTHTPILPPGKGGIVRDQDFYIQLIDYEIRPYYHPENAAIKYTLRFVNESDVPAQVTFSLEDISAVDNNGIEYMDYFVLAKRSWLYCFSSFLSLTQPDFSVINTRFNVPPKSHTDITTFLNKRDTVGNCEKYGAGKSRVDIHKTHYIDVKLDRVNYRTYDPHSFSPKWRLTS